VSYDYLMLPMACDHKITAERLAIGDDSQTLFSVDIPTQRMSSPINGLATLRLKFNGEDVPPNHPEFAWGVTDDELAVPPDKRSKIVFVNPIYMRDVVIEASYTTTAAYCWKCGGTSVVPDLSLAQSGAFTRVLKRKKLVQKALKFLLTSKCVFYPNLTCQLREYVGRKFGYTLTSEDVSFEVMASLDNMRAVQGLQVKYQRLDAEEILQSVDGVGTVQDPNDPTVIRVAVDVSSPAGTRDQVNVGLRVTV
jgi:hypothetical protein